jgi:hypothetical protein
VNEISFNITPDEDEIKNEIRRMAKESVVDEANYRNNFNIVDNDGNKSNEDNYEYEDMEIPQTREFEKENVKIQNEAKELIEKTRRMMETIDAHKLNDNKISNVKTYSNTSRNNMNNEYIEEKPFESLKIIKMEKEDINKSNII